MNNYIKIISLSFLVGLVSCSSNQEKENHKYHGVIEKIKDLEKDSITYAVNSTDLVENMQLISVETKEVSFFIPERKSKIKSFQCSECHTKSIPELKFKNLTAKKAHWNIELNHATSEVLTCNSCHPTQNLNHLKSNLNAEIDFNQSYKVCAQCHSSEYKDWLGGAHGKRLGGWINPRIAATCVDCHNPHSPKFESRFPSRLNTKKIEERR
ncbi:MAG: cytochrome C [Flavobacteriaceae bacterium]|nr:cytochrome C [Flavobacteriaceae bacterium]